MSGLRSLRAKHVWGFVVVAGLAAGSLPAGTGRYVATLIVCAVGITGFVLTMLPAAPRGTAGPVRSSAVSSPTVLPSAPPALGHEPQSSTPTSPAGTTGQPTSVAVLPRPRLSGPVDTVPADELVGLVGEQVTGGDGHGVQMWATPVIEGDGLDVEFIDASGAYTCLRLTAEGFVTDDE